MLIRFIRAIEELARAGNRLATLWESEQTELVIELQKQIDDLVAQLKSSREPLSAAVDESSKA